MVISWVNIILAVLVLSSFALLFCSLLIILGGRSNENQTAENILASLLITVLIIIVEVYLLSSIPITRPLRYLWPFQLLVVLIVMSIATVKHGFESWRKMISSIHSSLFFLFKESSLVVRLIGLLVFVAIAIYFVYGAFVNPAGWDTLAYHIPLAVQPYQDGRLSTLDSFLPWVYLYPRGSEIIWFWTLQLTHSDLLFNAVQLMFGGQLLLAVYILAKRTGITLSGAVLSLGIIATMPLLFVLTTTGYIDLNYAATIVAIIAFLAPSENDSFKKDIFFASLALAIASLIKIPVTALVFFVIALVSRLIADAGYKKIISTLFSWTTLLSLAVIVLGNLRYLKNWVIFHNPINPLSLSLFGKEIFHGSINPSEFGLAGISLFGDVSKMSHIQKFYSSWSDLFNPLNADSFGSTGPIFILIIVFLFLVFATNAIISKGVWHKTLALLFALSFFIPGFFLPRYAIPMIAIGVIGAVYILQRLDPRILKAAEFVILVFCIVSFYGQMKNIREGLKWLEGFNYGKLSLSARTTVVAERVPTGYESYPSPALIKYLRDNIKKGELLVWDVDCFQAYTWNRHYDNRTQFLAGSGKDYFPASPFLLTEPSEKEQQIWEDKIRDYQPNYILVYKDSVYPKLILGDKGLSYKIAFEEESTKKFPMTILKRAD